MQSIWKNEKGIAQFLIIAVMILVVLGLFLFRGGTSLLAIARPPQSFLYKVQVCETPGGLCSPNSKPVHILGSDFSWSGGGLEFTCDTNSFTKEDEQLKNVNVNDQNC